MSDLPLVFKTDGPWGTGVNRNLTKEEGDENIWQLAVAYAALATDRPEPVNIASIDVAGRFMTINLSNATQLGPFPLPVTEFRFRGEWEPLTVYDALDWFTVSAQGVYSTMYDHTSAETFDEAAQTSDTHLPLYKKLFGPDAGSIVNAAVYDIEFLYEGLLSDITGQLPFLALRAIKVPATDIHLARIETPAAAQEQVLPVLHNETVIGHVTFPVDSQVGTVVITSEETIERGDVLAIGPPATADGTARLMTVAIATTRVL